MLGALEIPAEWLPPTFEGPETTGRVTHQIAELTGLTAGTPVVAGGGDQAAQAVGVGAVEPGTVALTLGTSGVVFAPTSEPLVEPEGRLHAFCHALPGRWHLMGVMLAAAGSLHGIATRSRRGCPSTRWWRKPQRRRPGARGSLFLPYLSGERTPYPDPLARGAFIGLTLRHRRAHLTRAVLEGVAFGLRDGFALLGAAGLAGVERVLVSGGGTRSALWLQILATVVGVAAGLRRADGGRGIWRRTAGRARRGRLGRPTQRGERPQRRALRPPRPGESTHLRAHVRAVPRRLSAVRPSFAMLSEIAAQAQ